MLWAALPQRGIAAATRDQPPVVGYPQHSSHWRSIQKLPYGQRLPAVFGIELIRSRTDSISLSRTTTKEGAEAVNALLS